MFTKEMQDALNADGEKLRQLTGEDHGPEFIDGDTRAARVAAQNNSEMGSQEDWDAHGRFVFQMARDADERVDELEAALRDLVEVFQSNPYLPCETGELPPLDRARAVLQKSSTGVSGR